MGVETKDLKRKFEDWETRLAVLVVGVVGIVLVGIVVVDHVLGIEKDPTYYHPYLGTALLGYIAFMFVARTIESGSFVLFEGLWCCNLAIVCAGVGMITRRPVMVSMSMIGVSMDQFCWYIDVAGFIAIRKFPVGVAKYMVWPRITLMRKLTSTHHLWFIPLCMYTFAGCLPCYSWAASCFFTSLSTIYARFTTPKFAVDRLTGQLEYLNINAAYEFWRDVDVPILKRYDGYHPAVYISFMIVAFNPILNGPPYLVLRLLSSWLAPGCA